MMKIEVIHKAFSDKDNPRTVATVTIPKELLNNIDLALEYAFGRTQNIFGSWSKEHVEGLDENLDWNNNVEVMVKLERDDKGNKIGLRSTSVDDEMIAKIKVVTDTVSEWRVATKYRVAGIGFKRINK